MHKYQIQCDKSWKTYFEITYILKDVPLLNTGRRRVNIKSVITFHLINVFTCSVRNIVWNTWLKFQVKMEKVLRQNTKNENFFMYCTLDLFHINISYWNQNALFATSIQFYLSQKDLLLNSDCTMGDCDISWVVQR